MKKIILTAQGLALLFSPALSLAANDPLSLWNDTADKQKIIQFVTGITTDSSPTALPPPERVAVFDNDGTLWAENPVPLQYQFAIDQLKAVQNPNVPGLSASDIQNLLKDPAKGLAGLNADQKQALLKKTHTLTPIEYKQAVTYWLGSASSQALACHYKQLAYAPMVQLVDYLEQSGFKIYIIASPDSVDFTRILAEQMYGLPASQVLATPNTDQTNELRLDRIIGKEPVFAVGNSDADIPMLRYTSLNSPALPVLIHHTDAAREWQYDHDAAYGQMDKALNDATQYGWLVIDMKNDFKEMFMGNNCHH
ncbi:hypothetical protein ACFORL_03960 [Legionella dresdenensis]|uniref:Haloacid dehalogenase-like hydrolase n=1 Tax=Legionella dresdenensis TaxID=450200 RepID=A0ABV8CE23_9GAMM